MRALRLAKPRKFLGEIAVILTCAAYAHVFGKRRTFPTRTSWNHVACFDHVSLRVEPLHPTTMQRAFLARGFTDYSLL